MSDVAYRRKVIPTAISILWREGDSGDVAAQAYPLFLQQRAITALHDHFRSSPDQGVLGFLLGNLYECPESGVHYAVIDLVMRLSAQIYADKTTLVVSRVWDKMQEELSKSGGRLLGWYHSHPPAGIELPAGDVETHLQYFAEPWQVALVLGADANGPLGGFFRPSRDARRPPDVLPFYEILDPRAVTPDGKKKSSVRWKNYKAHRPPPVQKSQVDGFVKSQVDSFVGTAAPAPDPMSDVVTPQATVAIPKFEMPPPPPPPAPKAEPPAPPPPAPRIEPPPQKPGARPSAPPAPPLVAPASPPPPPPLSRPSPAPTATAAMRRARMSRRSFSIETKGLQSSSKGPLIAVIILVLLAAAGAGYWYVLRPRLAAKPETPPPPRSAAQPAPRDSAPPATPSGTVAAPGARPPAVGPVARLDQLSDTLSRLVGNYQERARLYETRQIDCSGLSRGLVAVESIWIAYNAERRTLSVPLDADRAGRDQALYTAVDSVESHFDRSRCDRP